MSRATIVTRNTNAARKTIALNDSCGHSRAAPGSARTAPPARAVFLQSTRRGGRTSGLGAACETGFLITRVPGGVIFFLTG